MFDFQSVDHACVEIIKETVLNKSADTILIIMPMSLRVNLVAENKLK